MNYLQLATAGFAEASPEEQEWFAGSFGSYVAIGLGFVLLAGLVGGILAYVVVSRLSDPY